MSEVCNQTILCLSGRKSSGKNTLANYVFGLNLKHLGIIRDSFAITQEGWLWVSDIYGDKEAGGVFNVNSLNEDVQKFLYEEVYASIKLYSFADSLKEFCMDVFGLTPEQCYGTDEQKNSVTELKWENCPGITTQTGPMTARQVLQYFGTDVCRKLVPNCWAQACLKKIKRENSSLAIITDCRFPDEVQTVQENGGYVVRLTRNPYNDNHSSETALDSNNYNWENFDYIFDNESIGIVRSCIQFQEILKDIGIVHQEENQTL